MAVPPSATTVTRAVFWPGLPAAGRASPARMLAATSDNDNEVRRAVDTEPPLGERVRGRKTAGGRPLAAAVYSQHYDGAHDPAGLRRRLHAGRALGGTGRLGAPVSLRPLPISCTSYADWVQGRRAGVELIAIDLDAVQRQLARVDPSALPTSAAAGTPEAREEQRRLLTSFALELAAVGSKRHAAAAARLVEWACPYVRAHTPEERFRSRLAARRALGARRRHRLDGPPRSPRPRPLALPRRTAPAAGARHRRGTVQRPVGGAHADRDRREPGAGAGAGVARGRRAPSRRRARRRQIHGRGEGRDPARRGAAPPRARQVPDGPLRRGAGRAGRRRAPDRGSRGHLPRASLSRHGARESRADRRGARVLPAGAGAESGRALRDAAARRAGVPLRAQRRPGDPDRRACCGTTTRAAIPGGRITPATGASGIRASSACENW